ncbi:MAG TPA: dienelactone hydrolase family protein [Burkholderiaceae bacterium]|nr:dienelactone hydrolase family protein [Burkholderiaceae bacterium]
MRPRVWLVAVGIAGCAVLAAAQTEQPVDAALALDLHEQVLRLPVTVKDSYGRQETRSIALTQFKPPGDGPFPLAIVSHGRATAERRSQQGRQRFEPLARYLVNKGFVVLVPTRVGYGDTYGDFDPEDHGGCSAMRVEPVALAASDQVIAAAQFARTLAYVDASQWVAIGQSVGGLTSVAVASRNPPGLIGAINFSGGAGGDPQHRPGQPCTPVQIERLWRQQAATVQVPMLWLYWDNDKYWGAEQPKRWYQAFSEGGGKAQMHTLPAAGVDGHGGVNIDMDTWVPIVEAYLARLGFTRSGVIARPSPKADSARVDDVAAVPTSQSNRDGAYKRFLDAKLPRAFAIGPRGAVGWASGDWAIGRALGFCQRYRGDRCHLYAVDDDVVWAPAQ